MNTLVVNLFGVPSAGKTRGSFHICDKLKEQNINVEYVPEFAREKIHEGSTAVFDNEVYIFGEQYFRISRLYGKVPLIVTDRPLPLSILYNNNPILGDVYNTLVMSIFNSMNNLNFLILRDENKPFQQSGRQQTKEEALALNEPLMNIMKTNNIMYSTYTGITKQYDLIVEDIIRRISK